MTELTAVHITLTHSHLELHCQLKNSLDSCPSCDPTVKPPLWPESMESRGTAGWYTKHLWTSAEFLQHKFCSWTLITRRFQKAIQTRRPFSVILCDYQAFRIIKTGRDTSTSSLRGSGRVAPCLVAATTSLLFQKDLKFKSSMFKSRVFLNLIWQERSAEHSSQAP